MRRRKRNKLDYVTSSSNLLSASTLLHNWRVCSGSMIGCEICSRNVFIFFCANDFLITTEINFYQFESNLTWQWNSCAIVMTNHYYVNFWTFTFHAAKGSLRGRMKKWFKTLLKISVFVEVKWVGRDVKLQFLLSISCYKFLFYITASDPVGRIKTNYFHNMFCLMNIESEAAVMFIDEDCVSWNFHKAFKLPFNKNVFSGRSLPGNLQESQVSNQKSNLKVFCLLTIEILCCLKSFLPLRRIFNIGKIAHVRFCFAIKS